MNDSKNELCEMAECQTDPHKAKASDFKVSLSGKVGETPGSKDQLADFGNDVRHNEDGGSGASGAGEPTGGDWGAAAKGRAHKVSVNSGEGDESPSKVSIPFSVDLADGQVKPDVAKIRNKEA